MSLSQTQDAQKSLMPGHMTPAGLQLTSTLLFRRLFVALLNLGVYALLLLWLASIFAPGGWTPLRAGIFIAFAIAAPWSVLGVCNSLIGLCLQHLHPRGLQAAAPFAAVGEEVVPLRKRTAILMTIRNEAPARAFARLRAMQQSVNATGQGASFDWFVLSDTTDAAIAAAEEAAFAQWRTDSGPVAWRQYYRRRDTNEGYKAGNIRDFCERWGAAYEFMLPLDADSLMDGDTILRLVRICEAYPKLGILQSLVVGAPSRSAFARIFQFGMRHGMRCYTLGASWWTGDCGPFWGHNAVVRIAPFAKDCVLPTLRDGAHVMSHDQLEAALMRRAGYEVRVLPVECGSFEENPPTLLEFTRRDLRWCEGNMQYWYLLGLPGLKPMSRFQMVWAISMFIGVPAWTLIIALVALMPAFGDVIAPEETGSAIGLYLVFIGLYLAPKLTGLLDVVMQRGGLARYGGGLRFAASACVEILFSFLIGAATTLRTSLFLGALAVGQTSGWTAQNRDAHALSWTTAARGMWPQTLFGLAIFGLGLVYAPMLLVWSIPLTIGYLLAIPFAVVTAAPALGAWFVRHGLCPAPEELDPPAVFQSLSDLQAKLG